ncbi:MAG: hypothetical protein ALECFALPRED_003958 [Alectoria fallacina]|uniref:Condensation domain-containing protein n=1 Tax=Alectoria fallacina TaxID=1903189 RepID=A0A8H3IHE3_9LECA|nr:MAG: hypothetical protein ALECFALPRED_003958 [Alectoria fallacina]
MPWSEVAPGKFQRAFGENEIFIKLLGDPGHPVGREHWAINSIASFALTGSLAKEDLPSLFLKAWKNLRFHHPSIAVQAVDDKSLVYTVPDSAALDQWTAETFHVVGNKTADDLIPDIKPDSYATLTYLPKSNEILGHTAHWRTDGVGVLLLIDAFFNLVTRPALPDPNTLAWGQETARLAPAVEDAANIPIAPTDAMKSLGQKSVETFYQAAGAVGIPYKGEATTLPSGTRSSRFVFSTSDTDHVISQCKARGFSVTSAVQASVAATNHALASVENKNKHYTSTVRFSIRPYLPKPYCTPAYASGLYTTGWIKAISASASWVDNAKAYNDEYRKGLNKEFIDSHREYALGLGNLIRSMPQPQDPPSDVDISSIGIAESLIERVKGTQDRGLEVQSVSVGVEILTRQCVCFVWTFRDRLNLNLVYNESFHDEKDTALFLQTLVGIMLKELAEGN